MNATKLFPEPRCHVVDLIRPNRVNNRILTIGQVNASPGEIISGLPSEIDRNQRIRSAVAELDRLPDQTRARKLQRGTCREVSAEQDRSGDEAGSR